MRVLFSCVPWEGHYRPLVPLARELAGRGHDVAFATSSAWEERALEDGFELIAVGPSEREVRAEFAPLRERIFELPPETRRPHQFSTLFGRIYAPAKAPDLIEATRSWRADAIVHDSCDLASPLAAAVTGVAAVNHSFGVMVPVGALEAAMRWLEPLWLEQGLEPEPHGGSFRGLFVDLAPASFARERPPGAVVRMRPATESSALPPPWLAELEPPLVYVTMGTVHNEPQLFRPLLDGLDGQASALVTIGRSGDLAALGPIPPRVRVERFVPQEQVLPLCAAVVGHGGSGTTLGALAHGLPLVLVPQAADQFDNAARAEAAGAAVVLRPGELTADAVRAALGRVLGEPSFTAAARRIAREIAEMATVEEAAATVEEHVGGS